MEIKVLGSSSAGNCYIVSDGVTTILLDCGLPIRLIMCGISHNVGNISGCFITHSHGDHIKAARDLQIRGVPIFGSPEEMKAGGVDRFRAMENKTRVTVGTLTVLAFDIQHDTPQPLGYFVSSSATHEKLLYFTDTYYIKYRFGGMTHILCECNYDAETLQANVDSGRVNKKLADRLLSSHMSLEHLTQMLKANDLSKVQQIYLCHLSDRNSNAERYRREIQSITGAEVYIC